MASIPAAKKCHERSRLLRTATGQKQSRSRTQASICTWDAESFEGEACVKECADSRCSRAGESLPARCFYQDTSKTERILPTCRKCRAKDAILKRRANYEYINALKRKIGKCQNPACGRKIENGAECQYDYDHRDAEDKYKAVAKLADYDRPRIDREVVKCDLLCAHCHMDRTAIQQGYHQSAVFDPEEDLDDLQSAMEAAQPGNPRKTKRFDRPQQPRARDRPQQESVQERHTRGRSRSHSSCRLPGRSRRKEDRAPQRHTLGKAKAGTMSQFFRRSGKKKARK